MARTGSIASLAAAAALAGACASTQIDQPPSLVSDAPLANDAAAMGGYQLSESEKKYDCKKLSGTMHVRILQIRDYDPSKKASAVARGIQSVSTPVFGGTTAGIDPDGQYRKDRAMLDAYNQQLAAKGCKTFDIDAELKSSDLYDMPGSTPGPATAKPAADAKAAAPAVATKPAP
jgi:hypothetical protein